MKLILFPLCSTAALPLVKKGQAKQQTKLDLEIVTDESVNMLEQIIYNDDLVHGFGGVKDLNELVQAEQITADR